MLARNGSVPPSWKPGAGWRYPDMATAPGGDLPISGSGRNSETLPMWKKICEVVSVAQMVLGVLLALVALGFVQHSSKTVLVVSGIVMAKLGSLGFLGANKLAPRALMVQLVGSVGVIFLVFGGVNQVARNVEVDCTFGEVFVRVFHMEERLQAVKHDEMVSSLFLRLNQMDDMLDMVRDGALEDLTMRTRVNSIVEQDKNLIRTKLQKMHQHAREVLDQLREESLNGTVDSSTVSTDTKKRIRENVEQRILSAQFALERIEKHLQDHNDLSSQEYELLLEALTHGTTHDGLREEIASHKNDAESIKDALTRHKTGVIEDSQAHRAATEVQKIKAHREETRRQFEVVPSDTAEERDGQSRMELGTGSIPSKAAWRTTADEPMPTIWSTTAMEASPDMVHLPGERDLDLQGQNEDAAGPNRTTSFEEIEAPLMPTRPSITFPNGSMPRNMPVRLSSRISINMSRRNSESSDGDININNGLNVTFDEETQAFVWKSNDPSVAPRLRDRLVLKLIQMLIYRDTFTGGFKMMSKHEAIHPQCPLRTRWDVFCLVPLLYVCLFVPFQIGFDLDAVTGVEIFVDLVFALDMLFNFFTGFEKDGNVELDKRKSMVHYLKVWFWLDLVATFPVEYVAHLTTGKFGNSKYTRILKLVRLIRLLRVLRLSRILNRLKWWAGIRFAVRKIIRFIIMITTVAHWNACLWGFMASVDDWDGSWAGTYGMETSTTKRSQYLTCIYWAITTMTTIGYGDIVPITTAERVLTIMVMCSGSCAYAYGITQIVTIVSNLSKATVRYQGKMDMLHEYMAVRRLPSELCHRILEFYEFKKEHSCSFLQENDILVDLPHSLRSEVSMYVHEALATQLGEMPLFKGLSDVFLRSILVRMRFDAYPPGETVVMEGEIGSTMFFISKGQLRVVVKDVEVARLCEGEFFGEVAMYHNKGRRTATVGTITYCENMTGRGKKSEKPSQNESESLDPVVAARNGSQANGAKEPAASMISKFKEIEKKVEMLYEIVNEGASDQVMRLK
ncbi:hypothetical protein BSKO_05688 [Bryopsis sp. KO-2023]|nr:hypothetical protein BSKO_05688 [Bryopsis sp. KO-2023]